jgi:maltooligosyltrehalose trehalohydrolase
VRVVIGEEHALDRDDEGYFEGIVPNVAGGARYGFRLDDDETIYPDPASRFQPDGPHGRSMVIDPTQYKWRDRAWRGVSDGEQILYELHIGTFTREGTWRAAANELPYLADLGITILEVMPVADFPGDFGWGYDGVDLFAPTRLYGTPDDMRFFVDEAHSLGLAIILDVVYNHLGPSGNYLGHFTRSYFSDRYVNEWGEAMNFDGERSGPVREFFASNAAYWIDEFHLDGLRLDATQSMHDATTPDVVTLIAQRARAAAGGRRIFLVAENEPQEMKMVMAVDDGGRGLDAVWNDDFHHSMRVALTGRIDAYYNDYRGTPQELVSMAKHGFLYQGQWYTWQKQHRGTPSLGIDRRRFVVYLQNHDQVANSAFGRRIHQLADPASVRAATALLLLGPQTPMLLQGQEFAASAPFVYFADHERELASLVAKGRKEFLMQFKTIADESVQKLLPPPDARETFESAKLDHAEREQHAHVLELHRELIRLRRKDAVLSGNYAIDGAVLGSHALLLRFFGRDGERLLLVNFGAVLPLVPMLEPLLAPPAQHHWTPMLSTEEPRFGGEGTPAATDGVRGPITLPARAALLFASARGERRVRSASVLKEDQKDDE